MSQAGFTAPLRVHLLDLPRRTGFTAPPGCTCRVFSYSLHVRIGFSFFLTLVTDTSFASSRIYSTARVHLLNRPDGQDLQHLRDAPVGPNKNLFLHSYTSTSSIPFFHYMLCHSRIYSTYRVHLPISSGIQDLQHLGGAPVGQIKTKSLFLKGI